MGAAIGRLRRREEPDAPDDAPDPKRARLPEPDSFVRVLRKGEAVTQIVAYAGATSVLTLETLSARAHASIRSLEIQIEAHSREGLRRPAILAIRHELVALRRAGSRGVAAQENGRLGLMEARVGASYTHTSSDVRFTRDAVARFMSPRRGPRVVVSGEGIDIERSEQFAEARERMRVGLLGVGVVVVDTTQSAADDEGLQGVKVFDSIYDAQLCTPKYRVDATVAAELVEAMGGADVVPRRLQIAATRDWTRNFIQGPEQLATVIENSAAASAYADVATLERVVDAFGLELGVKNKWHVDEDGFMEICREVVSARTARGLWREGLRGLVLPFSPRYVQSDGEGWEGGVVRVGNDTRLALHSAFDLACAARAVVSKFRGDASAIFSPEREAEIFRGHFWDDGELAVEVLKHLGALPDGAARVDAALALLTSEERLPLLAEGDRLFVATNWDNGVGLQVEWARATFVATILALGAHTTFVKVRLDDGNAESVLPLHAIQRDYGEGNPPIAAQILAQAVERGDNRFLVRIMQAPAMREHALGFGSHKGYRTTALDVAIFNGNVVGAAIMMARAGGGARFASIACRKQSYMNPKFAPDLRADMATAVGLAHEDRDPRWKLRQDPTTLSRLEHAAASGDVLAVRVELVFDRILASAAVERVTRSWARARATIDQLPDQASRALMTAAYRGHTSVVREILRRAPSSCSEDPMLFGILAGLQLAVIEGHVDCVESLLEAYLEVAPPGLGPTVAKYFVIARSAQMGHTAVLERLRDRGHSLYNGFSGYTPLEWCGDYGHVEACEIICADPDVAQSVQPADAIVLACTRGRPEILKVLLETAQLDDFDRIRESGRSPLNMAAVDDNEQIAIACVELLLDHGYPINEPRVGRVASALACAAGKGHRDLCQILIERGAIGADALLQVLAKVSPDLRGNPEQRHAVVELLLRERRDVSTTGLERGVAWAVLNFASLKTIGALLDAGANPSGRDRATGGESDGETALHWAVERMLQSVVQPPNKYVRKREEAEAIIRLLIERGADTELVTLEEVHSVTDDSPAVPPGATPRDLCMACSNAAARDAVLAVYDDAVAQRVA